MGVFGGVEKVRALGANGVARGSTICVVWFEVGGGMVSAKVVSMVVLGLSCECIDEVSLEDRILLLQWEKFDSCSQWDQECSYPWDHFPLLGLEKRDHDMVHKLEVIGQGVWLFGSDILKKPSEKHGIRESHFATLSHTYYSMSDIVSKIEVFANGETIEHVAQGCIGVIFVTDEAYGIFTNDGVPLLEFIS
nr:hypothetical protein [Tanacetum cinerariifolium]